MEITVIGAKRRENAKKENVINNGKCHWEDKKEDKKLGGLAGSQKTFKSLDGIKDSL